MAENIWAALSEQLAGTAERIGKSVVAVHTRGHASSGTVLDQDTIITTEHAVRRSDSVKVVVGPSKSVAGHVVGRDSTTDLAVVKLDQAASLDAPRWTKSPQLSVGDLVLALARSARGNIVASSGILSGVISGAWRTWRGGELDQFIRPDLMFYRGFSGGPLVNSAGEVVGINTAGLHRSGVTIPASTVLRVVGELIEKGRIERPYLGLAMQAVALQESLRTKLNLKSSDGLLVVHVEPGSPAESAGLLLGDVVTELEGHAVTDTSEVQDVLRSAKVGGEVNAGLVRAGAIASARIKLAARP